MARIICSRIRYKNRATLRENQIFMGNGFVSGAECFKLVDSLHKALEILGGIQQSHNRKEAEEGQEEVNKIAKNIYEKLTGNLLRRGAWKRQE
jgi:predicted HNH restriction endonuclease